MYRPAFPVLRLAQCCFVKALAHASLRCFIAVPQQHALDSSRKTELLTKKLKNIEQRSSAGLRRGISKRIDLLLID